MVTGWRAPRVGNRTGGIGLGVASVGNAASRRVLEKAEFVLERQMMTYLGEEVALYRKLRAAAA
jgi:hypothetical protein